MFSVYELDNGYCKVYYGDKWLDNVMRVEIEVVELGVIYD